MRIAPLVVAAVLTPAAAASAQLAGGLSVGSGFGQLGGGAWMRESRIDPVLQLSSPFAALRIDGTVAERIGAITMDRATLAGLAATPAMGPFRLSIEGAYRRDVIVDRFAVAEVAPALSLKRAYVGTWFGSIHRQRAEPMLQAGIWGGIGAAVLSLSSQTRSNTTVSIQPMVITDSSRTPTGWAYTQHAVSDTSRSGSAYSWSLMQARLDWSYRRLALNASVEISTQARRRDSTSSRHSGWVNAAVMLNQRLSLIGAAGTRPASRAAGATTGARFASLGVRFSPAMLLRDPLPAPVRPAASAFTIRQVDPGVYKLVFRVASARTVELSGDFNRWNPVAMTQSAPDVWEATVPLPSGTHRLNVRVNGDGWTAPPGLPAVDDEFNGRVGILVIR